MIYVVDYKINGEWVPRKFDTSEDQRREVKRFTGGRSGIISFDVETVVQDKTVAINLVIPLEKVDLIRSYEIDDEQFEVVEDEAANT